MKVLKTAAVLLIFLNILITASAESKLDRDFAAFGIESIGIYTEGYKDERVEDFSSAYLNAYSSQSIYTFRRVLCNFEGVTPKLMTSGYPLKGKTTATDVDNMLGGEINSYLESLNWKTDIINDFNGGSLKELLAEGLAQGFDAVMVGRYYSVEYFIPISGYNSINFGSSIMNTTRVGELQQGLALFPALELYDTKTGIRLWYSAYHTGTHIRDNELPYQKYVDNAEAFFVEGDAPERAAVETMVSLSLADNSFPPAVASGERNSDMAEARQAKERRQHLFWTQDPSYNFFGTLLGIGYSFDYIGDFDIYREDEDTRYSADFPEGPQLVGTVENAMMHRLTVPIFTIAAKNISFDPAFYFGIMSGGSTSITYTDYESNYPDSPTEEEKTSDVSSVWGLSVGMDVALKYYLRISDNFSSYIGARGLIEMWVVNVSGDEIRPLGDYSGDYGEDAISSSEFLSKVGGLAQLGDFTLNASVMAGIRFDTDKPFEIFGMFTPIGSGGGAMLSVGLKWYGISFEWIEPHSKNVAVDMRWK